MSGGWDLKTQARLWIFAGFAVGLGAALVWLHSARAWDQHLARSQMAGVLLYQALQGEAPVPAGLQLQALSSQSDAKASLLRGQRPEVPGGGIVTEISILGGTGQELRLEPGFGPGLGAGVGTVLRLMIVSDRLRYGVAGLHSGQRQTAAQQLGAVTRQLARHCSDPLVFAQYGDRGWRQVEGASYWGCQAAPPDLRLLAVILAAVGLAIVLSQSAETSARFGAFARLLRQPRLLGGPESYSAPGPAELQEIVSAVNDHLAGARLQIEKRAMVLSAVSHDLGTPATRLRLRAALIQDQTLRHKLEADIDSMTGMIESVLTYTRSELSLEVPRQISLTALVEALVADYQDLDRPVSYVRMEPAVVQGAQSLFSARSGQGALPDARRVLVTARPILLQRALTNLVDNALKYGRRAVVRLDANAERAVITVEDEGSELTVAEIQEVLAPFQRGANSSAIDGFGLGLTIVATVAEQHGGTLRFDQGSLGLRASLDIQRH
ncbi:sensor histidine kinase [Pseudophaeobacter arcticus]|uniref:sensor histidine kinase n=2 Tax=Pseudophaeobacter arcticus TaxID=385492 RepID=UPI002492DAD6|nr:ATP-binding protein [Pseudophaeobacter arcticus]